MIIDLPKAGPQLRVQAHPYPLLIGYQTQQFLHGYFFYVSLQDMSTAAAVNTPEGISHLEAQMVSEGSDRKTIESGWDCLQAYKPVFMAATLQNAVVAMNSHWDWYVRKLADFACFARLHVAGSPTLTTKQQRRLDRIGFERIEEQLAILGMAAGVQFGLTAQDHERLRELSMVRNLILHNRAEVDDHYLAHSTCKRFPKCHLREIGNAEGLAWYMSLLDAVHETCVEVGKRFVAAPTYSHL